MPKIKSLKLMKQEINDEIEELNHHYSNLLTQYQQITSSKFYKIYLAHQQHNLFNFLISNFSNKIVQKLHNKFSSSLIRSFLKRINIKNDRAISKFQKKIDVVKPKDELIQDKVSVIIPTLNAGDIFEVTLKQILNQKNIKNLEIIIIDSGSSDKTLEIAKTYQCKIITINKESFSHPIARNKAAKEANGKYLLFTVQDAFLSHQNTLSSMINFLEANNLAAISGRQIPRFDTDYFSSWQLKIYSDMLSPQNKDRIFQCSREDFNKLSNIQKRQITSLDDTCLLHKTILFNKIGTYDEKLSYGEDLAIGKKYLENNYKIAYLYSTGVIHSHNRPADYFLKRFYVDSKFLNLIYPKEINFKFSEISVQNLIFNLLIFSTHVESFIQDNKLIDLEKMKINKIILNSKKFKCTQQLLKYQNEFKEEERTFSNEIINYLQHFLNNVIELARPFIKNISLDELSQDEKNIFIDKVLAICFSNLLVDVSRFSTSNDFKKLDQILSEDI